MRRHLRWLVIAVVAVAGCSEPAPEPVKTRTRPAFGVRTANVLRSPDAVELFRVTNPFDERPERFQELLKTRPLIAGYPIVGEVKVDPESGRELARLLLDPQTYAPPGQEMMCLFRAGYVARFRRGPSHVDVVFCFSCSDLIVMSNPNLKERGFTESFSSTPGGKELYRIIKTLGPTSGSYHDSAPTSAPAFAIVFDQENHLSFSSPPSSRGSMIDVVDFAGRPLTGRPRISSIFATTSS